MIYGYLQKYQEKHFWTLREVLDPSFSKEDWALNNSDILFIVSSMTGFTSPLISEGEWIEEEFGQVLDLVIKRFHSFFCLSSDSNEFPVDKQKNFIAKLIMILEMTQNRYMSILASYEEAKDKLLGPVVNKTNSKNRFNDTPQNSGTYEDDPFTTNISFVDSETESDVDTIMGRIREIEGNYNNVLLNWSNEFDSLFIEEDNI